MLESLTSSVLLKPGDESSGLYFIFHHGPEGAAAIDLTVPHPDISYKGFQAVLDFEDAKAETDKIVLLGGEERLEDALIILHETYDGQNESHRIDADFSFLSYNYVLLPGRPPSIQTAAHREARITLKRDCDFLIVMGYRMWEGDALDAQIAQGLWVALPATKNDIFHIPAAQRRAKFLKKL